MFAKEERPVPNIVTMAIYEKPRHMIRRDATQVLGGMFGWNTPEETERALRAEMPGPTSSISSPDIVADSTLSAFAQRSGKRPVKRSNHCAPAPFVDMGASILSLHLQDLMRRQHEAEAEDKEEDITVTALVNRASTLVDIPVPVDPATANKARITDPPVAKKLRLTISTGPPAETATTPTAQVQLPLSPADTSSNASKASAAERLAGPVSSTPKAALFGPDLPVFTLNLSNLSGAFLSPDSDSDLSDLSSSISTRSATRDKGKGIAKGEQGKQSTGNISWNNTPSAPLAATSTRDPSTPPKRNRPTHKPGWIGWAQTEESPDRSRLIRLDDTPVILGRRTRSGREFADPPIWKRRPPPTKPKPKTDWPSPRKENRRPKPSKKSWRTSRKSKQQTAWQEAQKRSANGSDSEADSKRDEDNATNADQTANDDDLPLAFLFVPSTPTKSSVPANSSDVASSVKAGPAPASPDPILLPNRSISSAAPPSSSTAAPAPSTSASPGVLKLTRSHAVIMPTGVRQNEPTSEEANKSQDPRGRTSGGANPTSLGEPSTTVQPISKDDLFASPENVIRLGTKDTRFKSKDAALGPGSKSVLGTANNVLTLTGGSKSSAKSSLDGATKKFALAAGSSESKGASTSGMPENSPPPPKTTSGKVSPIKDGVKWNSDTKPLAPAAITKTPTASSNASNAATTTSSSAASSRTIKPFPMFLSRRRSDLKTDGSSKSSPTIPFVALGKRKEPSSSLPTSNGQSLSQAQPEKRKFVVNHFARKARMMELMRTGLKGDALRVEMEKWMDMERTEGGW